MNDRTFLDSFCEGIKPPSTMSIVDWGEENIVLSKEESAEPGPWRVSRTPYMAEPLRVLGPSDPVTEITILTGSQMAKTVGVNIWLGYTIDQNPCTMMYVQPTVDLAKEMSKDRLSPLIRNTECLRLKVKETKSKDLKSTILNIKYPGGRTLLRGANSAAGLAGVPVEQAAADETDRFTLNSDGEGCPLALIDKRMTTFPRRKFLKTSTPKDLSTSPIWKAYEASDQREYHVKCPRCGELITIEWGSIQFKKDENYKLTEKPWLQCPKCQGRIEEYEKSEMMATENGAVWIAGKPEVKDHAGFWINGLYSPWLKWEKIVKEFLTAKKERSWLKLKAWTNTVLAKPWDDTKGSTADHDTLYRRCKNWEPAPKEVILVTGGADVQDDRIEITVTGWGMGRESWILDHKVFPGSPALGSVWRELEEYLRSEFAVKGMPPIKIAATGIDTGGHHTHTVYEWVRQATLRGLRVYAMKGSSQRGQPVAERKSGKTKEGKNTLYMVGTDTAKEDIFYRLQSDEPGSGYCHFSNRLDLEYFKQLTAEKLVTTYKKGNEVREWVKTRPRNEALDCSVYSLAAYAILNPNMEALQRNREKLIEPVENNKKQRNVNKKSWVNDY